MAYINTWFLFSILFGLMLLVTLVMIKQSQHFYTKDPIVRKFSIMELEIPATPKELINLINGLYTLPAEDSQKSIRALKAQLILDFLFMPLAYGCIFLLCRRVAYKMESQPGFYVFMFFAIAQIVTWACDIIENVYLLGKINSHTSNKNINNINEKDIKKHKRYLYMEATKWGLALTALVCAISAVCYFWLTGNYSGTSFTYLFIVLVEIICFLFLLKLLSNKSKSY